MAAPKRKTSHKYTRLRSFSKINVLKLKNEIQMLNKNTSLIKRNLLRELHAHLINYKLVIHRPNRDRKSFRQTTQHDAI